MDLHTENEGVIKKPAIFDSAGNCKLLWRRSLSSYRFSDMPKLENSGVYSTEKPVFEDMHFLLKLMGHRQAVIQIVTIKE